MPFFKRNSSAVKDSEYGGDALSLGERLSELESRREALYGAIKELEFDYRMGKLSEADYEELDASYKLEAISLLKEIDALKGLAGSVSLEDAIEEEVRRSRSAGAEKMDDIEREILQLREKKAL